MTPITSHRVDVVNIPLSVGSSTFVHGDQAVIVEPKVDVLLLIFTPEGD